ncbi:ROK family protein [Corynebacterium sp. HS2168-gen11]|uniref:ROK family protein n=1 Tax=Corynebacterium sp. HS2168-gen11 TaxID=2974027 RepID=UPI00216ACB55|nr:ROK family protein [Corynebacterium sp. HS2168-gen11]MCS4536172.1 ROK family protein [Corynebacterium sp. HS2168-gen11]
MAETVTIGFDIGGTNMRAGVVTAAGTIVESLQVDVPHTSDDLERGMKTMVDTLRSRHDVSAVGVAVAGFLDPDCEIVRFAPHLPWREYPARQRLESLLELPVRLEHDANSAAWGEYVFGGAQGYDNWVLFAIGTGIGATIVSDGKIYRGMGTAPEFGHLPVIPHGRHCACGKQGCLERYASGTALEHTAQERLAENPSIQTSLRNERISGKTVVQHARAGDTFALEVVKDFSYWLGIGLSIVADVLDPPLILLGGGVSQEHDLFLADAKAVMASSIVGAGYRPLPKVAAAKLGADAGMIGVANLARQAL